MRNPHLVLMCWITFALVAVVAGVTWEWPIWAIGLLSLGLLGGAYMIMRHGWLEAHEIEQSIRRSLHELHQLMHRLAGNASLPSTFDGVASELQNTVEVIKERMRNLEEDRAKIFAIVQGLVEGVVAFDAEGKILFTNASAGRLLQFKEDQVLGRSVWEVIRHQDLGQLVEGCRNLPLHERQRIEVQIHTPTRMTIEVYGMPFPLGKHHAMGSVIVLHDVTQLRRLEQVRSEFVDNVSHELRTPLAAIIGYLETLIDEPTLETPNNRKFVHVAHRHAGRLSRLVEDLRSLSEIESGKVIVRPEMVGLKSLVDEVVEMFQEHIQKLHLRVSNQIDEETTVWTDRDRMIQILLNLVDNSIKYSYEGGGISFLVQRLANNLVLHVQDTGQGIPSTDLSRITERFYRVDQARSREEGGTGLGLSIVKHLVQLLGGQLQIQSELGKGTTVKLQLPETSCVKKVNEKKL